MSTIATFVTTVASVADIHPRLRRITLAAGDLHRFSPLGPDTFVYLLLPPPGRDELTIDATFTWEAYERMPEALRPAGAYYTVRAWRPERAELELWMVLHEPTGPAAQWAGCARPGDPVAVWGPREAFTPPDGTTEFLVVADETGLPAAAAIIESLTPDQRAVVIADVADHGHRPPLPERDGVTVRWVCHHDGLPRARAQRLVAAVRRYAPDPGTAYAWGGGESRSMTAVRNVLRHEREWPSEAVSMVAYWRHGGRSG